MTEADSAAIAAAWESNPSAIAEAEGHLKKGLMILNQEVGLSVTSSIVSGILARLHGEMPEGRVH